MGWLLAVILLPLVFAVLMAWLVVKIAVAIARLIFAPLRLLR